jgi:AcrR family transcriptional regulator
MNENNASPRERILATAADLFANQGYRATGVNEVIDKSGVAKATFYHHFPTKDDLCLAYLQERNVFELDGIKAFVASRRTPRSRLLAVMESLAPWLEANGLRGCGFLNMVAEEPNPQSPLRQAGVQHYQGLLRLIKQLARELIDSEPARYGKLNATALANDYLVILTGTVALVEIFHDTWPIRHGTDMVKRLVDSSG